MLERFKRYVKFETRSDENSKTIPSTPSQYEFAKLIAKELEQIGLENIYINEFCFVNATLKGNVNAPSIGFIAHLDTSRF